MSDKNNKSYASAKILETLLNFNAATKLKDRNALLDIVETIKSDEILLDFFSIGVLEVAMRESKTWDKENDKIYNTPWTKKYVIESGFEIYRVLLVKEDYKKIRELVAYMKSVGIDDKDRLYPKMLEAADVIKDRIEPDFNTLS